MSESINSKNLHQLHLGEEHDSEGFRVYGLASDENLPYKRYSMDEIDSIKEDVVDLCLEEVMYKIDKEGIEERLSGVETFLKTAYKVNNYSEPIGQSGKEEGSLSEARIESKYALISKAYKELKEHEERFELIEDGLKEAKEALESHSAFERSDFEESGFL